MDAKDKGPLIKALEECIQTLEDRVEEQERNLTRFRAHLYGDADFNTLGKLGELTAEIRATREEVKANKHLLDGVIEDRKEELAMRRGADQRLNYRLILNTVATFATAIGVVATIYLAVTGGA